jgi:hypothetical protein
MTKKTKTRYIKNINKVVTLSSVTINKLICLLYVRLKNVNILLLYIYVINLYKIKGH